jgi:septal ring factor EnvC (AmiA/AmiB activator)
LAFILLTSEVQIAMNYLDLSGLLSGLLQLAVACYALRLSWRFGTARVGWLVFGAFSLLALFHTLLAVNPFRVGLESGVIPDLAYGVVSVLLLTSIVRLESSLKKHWQNQREERRSLSEWESQVESQVAGLARTNLEVAKTNEDLTKTNSEISKTNDELRRLNTKLQVEAAEQKQLREQSEQTYQGLLTAARQTEKDLLQTIATLLAESAEQKQALATARQAGRGETAALLLEAVEALGSLLRDRAKSCTARIVQASKPARSRAATAGAAKPSTPRKRLPDSLAQLARNLSDDQAVLLRDIDSLKARLEQIKTTGTIPSLPAAAESTESAELKTDFHGLLLQSVTDTGTEPIPNAPETGAKSPAESAPAPSEVRA